MGYPPVVCLHKHNLYDDPTHNKTARVVYNEIYVYVFPPSPQSKPWQVSQIRSCFRMKDIHQATISTFHETSLIRLHRVTWIS